MSALCYAFVPEWPTFRDIHGVHAAQQVPDKQVVSLLPTQPVVAGEIEAQMGPAHVGHQHPVQEPAGVHPRVVVLNPGESTVIVWHEFTLQVITNEFSTSHAPMHLHFF